MKYPEHRMSLEATMPMSDSILSWLGHQLELRGIDSVIYTRYIISLLQQDVADIDRDEFWDRRVDIKKCKDKKDVKKKPVSEEERRKNAAVECLLSVSEGENDFESLVEELYIRLKETKSSPVSGYFSPLTVQTKSEQHFKTEVQDPAERYYAAFPALPGDGTPPQVSPSSGNQDNIWKRNRIGSSLAGETGNETDSPENSTPEPKEIKNSPKEVKSSSERKLSAGSKSSSTSPVAEKCRKTSKVDASQKVTPNPHGKKKSGGSKGKKEVEGGSKAVRFLSWPPPGHGKKMKTNPEKVCSEEEEKYCSMVEQMLKEMLLTDKKQATPQFPVLAYFPEDGFGNNCFTEWFREVSQSPEFTENDDWYTQPLDHMFSNPISQTKRLYKRHSYPPTLLNFEGDLEWSSLVAEQFLCLKRASREYILLKDVFDPQKDIKVDEPADAEEKVEDLEASEDLVMKTEAKECEEPVFLDFKTPIPTVEEEKTLEDSADQEIIPPWFEESFATYVDPFDFEEANFANFPTCNDEDVVSPNSKPSALSLTLPCPFPEFDPEYLVPASDTSSPVSSVEKGYFSDVTETSYIFDASRHSSPFPDMLLLMNYGEDSTEEESRGTGSLKRSRLESLFEPRPDVDMNLNKSDIFEVLRTPQIEVQPEFDFCADDLFPCQPEEENNISSCTRNMFPNGATSFANPQGEMTGKTIQAEMNKEQSGPENLSQAFPISDDSSSEERDESACFPSDLFNSFSSVGESSGGSVLDCQASLWFHLSPSAGPESSCWQNKILLHDYNEGFSFGNLTPSSEWAWDSVLGKKYIFQTVMRGSPIGDFSVGSTMSHGELWQLWDVNCQKKLSDVWQRTSESNIWNSILNLSSYTPGEQETDGGWTKEEDVVFAGTINEEDPVLGLQFLEEINGGKGPRYERSVSENDLNHMSNCLVLDLTKPNLDISYELIPSENSAFQGVVPKQLHHVRSAPNLRYKSLLTMHSDTDLQSLAAAAESPVEHLYFSARTHFRPIQTPVATPEEHVETQPLDLFGGTSDTGTPYQQFVNPGEEETKFKPKFKIQKDLDKYIQTGGSLDETDSEYERFRQFQLEQSKDIQTEFIEEVVGAVLDDGLSEYAVNPTWTEVPLLKTEIQTCHEIMKSSSDVGQEHEEAVVDLCENLSSLCTRRESERADPEQIVEVDDAMVDPKWDGQKIKEMHFSDQMKNYHDIWSSGYDMDLHPFSVENECSFLPCNDDEDRLCTSVVETGKDESKDEANCEHSDELYFYYLDTYPEVDSYILSACPEDCSEQQNYEVSSLIPIPHQAVYSSDLEKQWLDRKALTGKNLKRKAQKLKMRKDSSKSKPCSFFLEGNCRRSDCKFSHDLSSITCRFWEEGLCFKGTLCPFFHGYKSDSGTDSRVWKSGDRFEYKKDEFPELDNIGKNKHKDSHSQKISWKRQAHKTFLKKTLSSRKKNRLLKKPTRTVESNSC